MKIRRRIISPVNPVHISQLTQVYLSISRKMKKRMFALELRMNKISFSNTCYEKNILHGYSCRAGFCRLIIFGLRMLWCGI